MKAIAYGYDRTYTTGTPRWILHPDCRNPFLTPRRQNSIGPTWVNVYDGDPTVRGHPLCGVKCDHCGKSFEKGGSNG